EFGPYRLHPAQQLLAEGTKRVPLTPKAFQILLVLVESQGQIVSKEELLQKVWPDAFVEEATLAQNVFTLRKQLKDDPESALYIETIPKRGYRFVAPVTETASGPARGNGPLKSSARQEIRFCCTGDGVRIAWASVGSGYPLLKAANWLNHLEYEWESPVWKHLIAELTKYHRFIRYDERGNGLSDWDVKDISLDAWVHDLETVVDAARLDRFALMGISQGGA